MVVTLDIARAMHAERQAIRSVEAATPLPGVYLLTAPNGEQVHGALSFFRGFRGERDRVWDICGASFGDEQLVGWKIGPRVSGPGLREEVR
jgi:hypothetical protein